MTECPAEWLCIQLNRRASYWTHKGRFAFFESTRCCSGLFAPCDRKHRDPLQSGECAECSIQFQTVQALPGDRSWAMPSRRARAVWMPISMRRLSRRRRGFSMIRRPGRGLPGTGIVLAGLLSGLEVFLPIIDGSLEIPRGLFAALSGAATCAAFISRILAQRGVSDADQ